MEQKALGTEGCSANLEGYGPTRQGEVLLKLRLQTRLTKRVNIAAQQGVVQPTMPCPTSTAHAMDNSFGHRCQSVSLIRAEFGMRRPPRSLAAARL